MSKHERAVRLLKTERDQMFYNDVADHVIAALDYALQVLEAYPKLVAENRELKAALDECLPGLASNAILDAKADTGT